LTNINTIFFFSSNWTSFYSYTKRLNCLSEKSYIRFNPDVTQKYKIDIEDRIDILLKVIEEQIERIKKEENKDLVEIIKLFY